MSAARLKPLLLTLLKYGFAVGALWLVLRQMDAAALWQEMQSIQPIGLLAAYLAIHAAQLASARRMQLYCADKGIAFGYRYSVMLYYVGMFFNLVLPGGIGGDGYKIWHLKREQGASAKAALQAMLAERANGLLALLLILYMLLAGSATVLHHPLLAHYGLENTGLWLLLTAMLVTMLCYQLVAPRITGESKAVTGRATLWSLLVQGGFCASITCLAYGLGQGESLQALLILFLAASLASLIPITVGGAGLRELVFFYGAPFFGLDAHAAVVLSLTYFVLYVLAALPGMVLQGRLRQKSPLPLGEG